MNPEECIVFEDAVIGVKAGLGSGARFVIGFPADEITKKAMESLTYDKKRTSLIILKSLKDFDYSLIE